MRQRKADLLWRTLPLLHHLSSGEHCTSSLVSWHPSSRSCRRLLPSQQRGRRSQVDGQPCSVTMQPVGSTNTQHKLWDPADCFMESAGFCASKGQLFVLTHQVRQERTCCMYSGRVFLMIAWLQILGGGRRSTKWTMSRAKWQVRVYH